MDQPGFIQVYTGDGKGKTTASLGLALRACGQGLKVLMIQFLKKDDGYGELKTFQYLPGFEIRPAGRNCMVNFADPDPLDLEMTKDAWEQSKIAIKSLQYDIVILDEINVVLGFGLLPVEDVVNFLQEERPRNVEIVLTGIAAPKEITDLADLVTEMKNIKHYFSQGIGIRNGIDH